LKALILAGGYAKRMWPLTKDTPKPLLLLGGRPAIDYILDRLLEANIKTVIVSTNQRFKPQFEEWRQSKQAFEIEILTEESRDEKKKLGAAKALAKLAPKLAPDDYIIIAGDNIFTSGINAMINFYNQKKTPVIAVIRADSLEEVKRGSSVTLDEDMRITSFEEKPNKPKSMLIGVCIYIMPHKSILRAREYLNSGGRKDELGNFAAWLCKREKVHGYLLEGRLWDVGTIESYEQLKKEFEKPAGD
jgi:glucose-1-phosphate thymidylyltransferase